MRGRVSPKREIVVSLLSGIGVMVRLTQKPDDVARDPQALESIAGRPLEAEVAAVLTVGVSLGLPLFLRERSHLGGHSEEGIRESRNGDEPSKHQSDRPGVAIIQAPEE